jgi:hypothetical protein
MAVVAGVAAAVHMTLSNPRDQPSNTIISSSSTGWRKSKSRKQQWAKVSPACGVQLLHGRPCCLAAAAAGGSSRLPATSGQQQQHLPLPVTPRTLSMMLQALLLVVHLLLPLPLLLLMLVLLVLLLLLLVVVMVSLLVAVVVPRQAAAASASPAQQMWFQRRCVRLPCCPYSATTQPAMLYGLQASLPPTWPWP